MTLEGKVCSERTLNEILTKIHLSTKQRLICLVAQTKYLKEGYVANLSLSEMFTVAAQYVMHTFLMDRFP